MVLTAFATIPHSKDMKEHKIFKYCEQLQKQQADVTCTYNHSVALVPKAMVAFFHGVKQDRKRQYSGWYQSTGKSFVP